MSTNIVDGATIRDAIPRRFAPCSPDHRECQGCSNEYIRIKRTPRVNSGVLSIRIYSRCHSQALRALLMSRWRAIPRCPSQTLRALLMSRCRAIKQRQTKNSLGCKHPGSLYLLCFASLVVRALSLWELFHCPKCLVLGICRTSCCLPAAYGRKLRATVCGWWQL